MGVFSLFGFAIVTGLQDCGAHARIYASISPCLVQFLKDTNQYRALRDALILLLPKFLISSNETANR